ncbi:MAG: DUF5657 family protein [Candidatus Dojkabacteria bacterium]|jgi:hypothetical protein
MDSGNDILNILGDSQGIGLSFSILNLFKIPFFLLILGNVFFIVLLYLRIKILADTFSSPNSKLIKLILKAHIALSIVASLVTILLIVLA